MSSRKSQVVEPAVTPEIEPAAVEPSPESAGEPERAANYPNPRSWNTHSEAGAEHRTRTNPYEIQIAFREKPSQAIIDYLKQEKFRWNGQAKVWSRPIAYGSQQQDRLAGQRAYDEVVRMLKKEKGIAEEPAAEVAF